jgi:hypothetical protein
MSLNDQETEPVNRTPSSTDGFSLKKPYESPALIEWGTIHDLTAGPQSDIQDDGFAQGSGPQ